MPPLVPATPAPPHPHTQTTTAAVQIPCGRCGGDVTVRVVLHPRPMSVQHPVWTAAEEARCTHCGAASPVDVLNDSLELAAAVREASAE